MNFDSFIEDVLRQARAVGGTNQMFRDRELGFKREELANRKYATDAQYGAGGASDREMLARERMTGLQYGVGGSSDRDTLARFGPGGAEDRRVAGGIAEHNIVAGTAANRLAAEKPGWNAEANRANAVANESMFNLGIEQELRPSTLAGRRSVRDLNAVTNQEELDAKFNNTFKQRSDRIATMPEWAGTPYTKTPAPRKRGWMDFLFGDYKPADKNWYAQ